MSRKLLIIILIGLVLASLVPRGTAGGAKVILWHAFTGGEAEALERVVKTFTAKYGIEVELVNVPFDQLKNKILQAVPLGEGPDVYIGPHDWIGELARAGVIEPLDDLLTDEIRGEYLESGLVGVSYGGSTYGLPESFKVPTLIYNKKLIEKPPEIIDELWALMEEFKKKYGGEKVALAYDVMNAYFSSCWFHALSAYYLSPEDLSTNIDSPGGVKAFRIVAKFAEYLPPDIGYDMAVNYFLEGKSAMIINGPWFIADLKKVFGEELADIGFALIPKVDGKWASPYMTVESVVMTRNAAERGVREEAFKLVRFLTTEGALVLAKEAGHVPAWKAAYEDPDVKGNRVIVAFFEQAKYATPMPNVPEMSVMWQVVPGWLAKVYHGEVTPEEAATNCAKELRDKLASL